MFFCYSRVQSRPRSSTNRKKAGAERWKLRKITSNHDEKNRSNKQLAKLRVRDDSWEDYDDVRILKKEPYELYAVPIIFSCAKTYEHGSNSLM